ncbi:MAG: GNAT family N-acetyltransferase [Alphaproteobacteria bacterium]|nr:GNAT family N-acetyltransferase [Alphaproteobacteria bacterium]
MAGNPRQAGGAAGGPGQDPVAVCRLADMPVVSDFSRQLDDIFYASSGTKSFADEATQAEFHTRWLGRYLEHYSDWFYVAVQGGRLIGYLAGCTDDPARVPRFSDIAYFKDLADQTLLYPAHLHVNVAEGLRGAGVGARLVARYVEDLRHAGIDGVHLVTGVDQRNVIFYQRNGFEAVKRLPWRGGEVVMLARSL